jgi:hypothetical protein
MYILEEEVMATLGIKNAFVNTLWIKFAFDTFNYILIFSWSSHLDIMKAGFSSDSTGIL